MRLGYLKDFHGTKSISRLVIPEVHLFLTPGDINIVILIL